MINCLIEPTSGHIFVNGRDIAGVKGEELRRTIGYAIQRVGLFPHLTVAANIAVVPQLLRWEWKLIETRVRDLLALVGLDPAAYSGKYPAQLSGGEAQRVGVARALAGDPPILLMDEPFGAVDPLNRERLQAQFIQVQAELKKTVIMVTHDLNEAIRLATRIAIMNAGRLVQYDTPEAILAKPASKFVHDFVGADRALKRLARLDVRPFVRASYSVSEAMVAGEAMAAMGELTWSWVVDEKSRLTGWVDRPMLAGAATVKEAMVAAEPSAIAVTATATLREALSRMLGYSFRNVPVVDESGLLIGQVSLSDIESATAEE